MTKISIRFYDDREVRAIWDEENSKWWFSAVDIVAAITDSPNPISTILPTIENMPKTTFDEIADDVVCQEFTLNINTFPYKMEFFFVDGNRDSPGVDFIHRF